MNNGCKFPRTNESTKYIISKIGKIRTHVSRHVECMNSTVELQNIKNIEKGHDFEIS